MGNNLMSSPYIDIPLQAYLDNLSNNIQELFKNYIYIDLNTICNESQCFSEDDRRVQFYVKKYEILEMPYILSINTNINNYNELIKYKDFINKIFKYEVNLYDIDYKLVGFVTQPSSNHFVAYFENYNERYPNSLKKWYKFDDLFPKYKEIKNTEFSLDNIRKGESISLLIYLRK